MRILYMANNYLGWKVLEYLKEQGEDIALLAVHPEEKAKFREEIKACSGLPDEKVIEAPMLRNPETLQKIREEKPDIGISVMFGYILKPEFISIFEKGVINLHPSYLPYNKGAYPNVWSIIENTPAGASMHYIDDGVDTGKIIDRVEVEKEITDTGKTLYKKLENACLKLFSFNWPKIKSGEIRAFEQDTHVGTKHKVKDIESVREIELDKEYKAGDLINILRATTFPPYDGAYFIANGRKVYMRMDLYYGEQEGSSNE